MSQAPASAQPDGRAAHVISQIYYYVAAVAGFGLLLGGTIGALFGVREILLPDQWEDAESGLRTVLHGLAFAVPGLVVMWWHLREARRREDRPAAAAFWGRSLYFHLMALLSLIFVLIGAIGVLFNLSDAATAGSLSNGYPSDYQSYSLRSAVNSAIFLIVGGPAFWWHLRQGRRLTASDET